MNWWIVPKECLDMIEDMKPTYNSIVLSGDEKKAFKWLGQQIQKLYKAGYPGVLVVSELADMITDA